MVSLRVVVVYAIFLKNGRKEEKKRAFLDQEGFEHVNKTFKCSKILREKGLIETKGTVERLKVYIFKRQSESIII